MRAWIDRLGLQIKDAAQHVGMETEQLERVLNFPDGATPTRVLLQVLEGLGLGIVGVESLTPAMLLRHFDQVRESKGMSKKDLSIRADVHRTYLIGLFQEIKPEPKLETILKLARALEVDLVIEKRRELPTLVSPAEQPAPPSQPQGPSSPDVATAQAPAASSPSTKAATPPLADALPPQPVATGSAATSESAPIGRELVHGRKLGATCRPAAGATRAARFIPARNGTADRGITADRDAAASGNLREPSTGTHRRSAVHQRARRSPGRA